MNRNRKKTPYSQYQDTEEWVIVARSLAELENNQDIELKTASEYMIGYLVERLRNKNLLQLKKKTIKSTNNKNINLR